MVERAVSLPGGRPGCGGLAGWVQHHSTNATRVPDRTAAGGRSCSAQNLSQAFQSAPYPFLVFSGRAFSTCWVASRRRSLSSASRSPSRRASGSSARRTKPIGPQRTHRQGRLVERRSSQRDVDHSGAQPAGRVGQIGVADADVDAGAASAVGGGHPGHSRVGAVAQDADGGGQPRYITYDRTGHNKQAVFKGSNSRDAFQSTKDSARDGTYGVEISPTGEVTGLEWLAK
jgi:hypothetical protein